MNPTPFSLEDYNSNFCCFLHQVKQSNLDYSQAYLSLKTAIKPSKNTALQPPSLEEIAQKYQIFLHRKNRGQRSSSLLKYWSQKHLDTFLFLVACVQKVTGRMPELFTDSEWQELAQILPYTKPQSLKYKWACLQNAGSKVSHSWTALEDQLLRELIMEMNPELLEERDFENLNKTPKVKWSFIAMELNQRAHRNDPYWEFFPKLGKHCRERWFNHLTPLLKKTEWTDQEDLELMELAGRYDRKWARIALSFQGRTQHNVKNRYLSLIAREYKISRKKLNNKLISSPALLQNTLSSLRKRMGEQRNNRNGWAFDFAMEEPLRDKEEEATMGFEKACHGSEELNQQEDFGFEEQEMMLKDIPPMDFEGLKEEFYENLEKN